MLRSHAATLDEARSYVAALADCARTPAASAAYERLLLELDWLHDDAAPAINSAGLTNDLVTLGAVAASAINELRDHGIDALQIELLLAALHEARDLDES